MKKTVRKNIELGVLFGLLCAVLLSFARFDLRCDELRQNVLRLHIIANSDSVEDQDLKLAVRDEILKNSVDIFKECNNLETALNTANLKTEELKDIANGVIKANGFDYESTVSVGDSYFNTREYDDFTLPAGTYKSLTVKLGNAQGKNWWCVVFPCVCVPSASEASLSDTVPDSAAQTAENASKYTVKFKTVEIYEQIKKIFSKK